MAVRMKAPRPWTPPLSANAQKTFELLRADLPNLTRRAAQIFDAHDDIVSELNGLPESDRVSAGRQRILMRHHPGPMGPNGLTMCHGEHEHQEEWPCPDYRDAAADLLVEEEI